MLSVQFQTLILQGYWQGWFDKISVNGETVIWSDGAIIDTGTTQVVGNPLRVQAIYDQIPDSQYVGNGTWSSTFMSKLPH